MSASGTYTLPCGCVALTARERWVTMCAEHAKAYAETRARWLADKAAADAINNT